MELNRSENFPFQFVWEPFTNDFRFCFFRLKCREVVKVTLARVFTLKGAREEESESSSVGSAGGFAGGGRKERERRDEDEKGKGVCGEVYSSQLDERAREGATTYS